MRQLVGSASAGAGGRGKQEGKGSANAVEARLVGRGSGGDLPGTWQRVAFDLGEKRFRGALTGPSGGWYRLEIHVTGDQCRVFMENLIRASRERAGWQIRWFTAQVTCHSEKDPAGEEFRGAQAALWKSGPALQGPGTDALRAGHRAGVHFNAKGIRRHGELWAEKVTPWLQTRLIAVSTAAPAPAITDESKVPPYTLPDPLVCQDGTKVTDARIWREKRRPELLTSRIGYFLRAGKHDVTLEDWQAMIRFAAHHWQ